MKPLDKLKLANKLKRVALAAHPHTGVTIIVHEKEPGHGGGRNVAVATTLPSRAHQRALLAEVVAQSILADGHDMEDVSDVAAADHRAYIEGEPES